MNGLMTQDSLLSIELDLVQELLIKQTKSGDSKFDVVVENWLSQRGKMLRPAFYLLSSRFGLPEEQLSHWQNLARENSQTLKVELLNNEKQMRFYRGAAAIELIHMATLIHDDVIDEAKLRRGRPSIQTTHGKDYAVYMGDFFFCKAILMVADHEQQEDLKSLGNAMTQICLGEIRQYHSRHILQPDLRNYFKIIASKTAALFSLSFYAGAIENGCGKKVASDLGKVGYNMGMAFQIIDDLLDYKPVEEIGKETYKDLTQGNINLPIHLALKSTKSEDLVHILSGDTLDYDAFKQIVHLIKEVKADEQSEKYAQKFTKRALKYLNRLPEHSTKALLTDYILALLSRKL
jgi:heptaprenyl diphosphate synthase